MLRLMNKASPGLVASSIIYAFMVSCASFVSGTLLLRFALNGIATGKTFFRIASVVLGWLVVQIIISGLAALYEQKICKMSIEEVKRKLHNMVYQKATDVELVCYENPKYYDKFSKAIDESGNRVEQMNYAVIDLVARVISFSANFILIITIDPVLILFIFIALLAIPLQEKVNRNKYKETMEIIEEKRRKDYFRRVFYLKDYAKEMRLSDMSYSMFRKFKESGERTIMIIKKYGFSIALLEYLASECNDMLATLGVTLYAVWQTFGSKKMGYGDCLVIVNSVDYISNILTSSTKVFLGFQEQAMYIENLREFLDYEPKLKSGTEVLPEEGDIVLDKVSFRYSGSLKDALHNVSMRFGAKEKVAIVGHNGAGKTTLVKLLLRFYDVTDGSILYGDYDIKKYQLSKYRNMYAAVMQDFHIFALSVAENVLLDEYKSEEEVVKTALVQSGLWDKVETFSEGIDTLLTKEFDENGEQMSGGEQQKLAISHVYTRDSRFVILDEPSSALDPIAEYEMYNSMMKACENCGVIFISHRLSSAVMADRVYMLEDGEVIESGTHQELMLQNGKYAEMFRRQALNYAEVEE